MYPLFKDGERIICMRTFFSSFSVGDIVVFKHPHEGLMIKELRRIDAFGFYVKGTTPYSIDSSTFGHLKQKDILYKVIYKL